jgi:hypothetical protein
MNNSSAIVWLRKVSLYRRYSLLRPIPQRSPYEPSPISAREAFSQATSEVPAVILCRGFSFRVGLILVNSCSSTSTLPDSILANRALGVSNAEAPVGYLSAVTDSPDGLLHSIRNCSSPPQQSPDPLHRSGSSVPYR